MKLFYSPGACSIGIHVLLEEVGKPYERELINLKEQEQYKEAYVAISVKSKVPALQCNDGRVLTEYGAIATWIARTNPEAKLIPADPDSESRMLEAMDYTVATIHMQGFTRVARPMNFTPDEAGKEAVQARGREIFAKGLSILADRMGDKPWVAGDEYSIGDSAVFYVSSWAPRAGVELPHGIAAHYARMKARPAVQRTIAAEGLSI